MKTEIERYLFNDAGWVSSERLCARFNIEPRQLRSSGTEPGLCSHFAISSARGFRHIKKCTDAEWNIFERRIRTHGISELDRVAVLRRLRGPTQELLPL